MGNRTKYVDETDGKRIEDARKLIGGVEVELHKLPVFLSKRINAYRRKEELPPARGCAWIILDETFVYIGKKADIDVSTCTLLDHWGQSKGGPYVCCRKAGKCFVTEPYGVDSDKAHWLDVICDTLGLKWHVSSDTWWNPGGTLRVTIHE